MNSWTAEWSVKWAWVRKTETTEGESAEGGSARDSVG
jgi:hypothetical protein